MNKPFLRSDIALLITRCVVGGIFIFAGWLKIADMETTVAQFNLMNIPAVLTYIVSYGEFIAGILLVLGLWSSFVALFLALIMLTALVLTKSGGFPVFGLPLVMLSSLVAILGCGVGKYRVRLPTSR